MLFSFRRCGKLKRGLELRYSISYVSKIESGIKQGVLKLGSLCLSCYVVQSTNICFYVIINNNYEESHGAGAQSVPEVRLVMGSIATRGN